MCFSSIFARILAIELILIALKTNLISETFCNEPKK